MKKLLKKRENRGQKSLQLYGCSCPCGGCASTPVNDSEKVYSSQFSRKYNANN